MTWQTQEYRVCAQEVSNMLAIVAGPRWLTDELPDSPFVSIMQTYYYGDGYQLMFKKNWNWEIFLYAKFVFVSSLLWLQFGECINGVCVCV